MNDTLRKALLPSGLSDTLMPDAAFEADMIELMLGAFAAWGYERVKPPLVEFEASLLDGPGGAIAAQMFRVMDPVSDRMMAIRADITPQVARIATSRLRNAARPLRLSYAGPVLQVKGTELKPEREITQVGIELIGSTALAADAEVIVATADALRSVGIAEPSFDLTMPNLVPLVCAAMKLDAETAAHARTALDRKDAGALHALTGLTASQRTVLAGMLSAAGSAESCVGALQAAKLGSAAEGLVRDLGTVVSHVRSALPDLRLTVDPVEFRGLEYQTGISFTVFVRGVTEELGRGGRYPLASGETATGATLFMGSVLQGVPARAATRSLYLPFGTTAAQAARARAEGWTTRAALESDASSRSAAAAQGCTHILEGGAPKPLPSRT